MVAEWLHQRSTTQRPRLLGDRATSLMMQRSQQITRRETDHRFPFVVSRSILGAETSPETQWASPHHRRHHRKRVSSMTCSTCSTCSTTLARFSTASRNARASSRITYVLFAVVGIVVLKVRGMQAITGFADLRAPLGLDLLTPNAGLYVGTVLNGINPFSVWGVWLAGTGSSITHGTSRSTAIAVTAGAFFICLLIIAAPTLLLGLL